MKPKRCKSIDVDDARCDLEAGHEGQHFRRCSGCPGGHHWPRPDNPIMQALARTKESAS